MEKRLIAVAFSACAIAPGIFSAHAAEGAGRPWKPSDIVVEQAWARFVPGDAKTGAVYLTIHNKSPNDALLLAVESSAAQGIAIHESRVTDGVATMEPLPIGLPIPSHGEAVMRPGGIHIMLAGLSGALAPGDLLPVRMVFREAGILDFEVPVLRLDATEPAVKHSEHGG